jgi:ribosomal protein S18 acetylase RimI-like enzyme
MSFVIIVNSEEGLLTMPYIEIRRAQAEDREAVLSFCVDTWEWGDYIEHTWEKWLQDSSGCLFVATIEQQPVGIVHMQMLTSIDAWLEGLRVDPAFRGQGIARLLNDEAVLQAMQRGAEYIRLLISSTNARSIQIVERAFWRRIGAFALYSASALPIVDRATGQVHTQLATLDDLDEVIDYLNVSNNFPLVGGIYYVGFTASPVTEKLLRAKIAKQQVYLLRRWDRLDGLAIAEVREEQQHLRLSVGYIDGMTVESISLIAYDLRCLLTELEVEQVRIYTPDILLVRDGLNGVEYEWDGTVYYSYERGLR